jgi:hypothetical protein
VFLILHFMKHIKQKFQKEIYVSDEQYKKLTSKTHSDRQLNLTELATVDKSKLSTFLIAENKLIVPAFVTTLNQLEYIIPEPDPVLIYFNNAQTHYKYLRPTKDRFLSVSYLYDKKEKEVNIHEVRKCTYDYMHQVTAFAVFIFISIEAMINKTIPVDYGYRENIGKCLQVYGFEQIQRHIKFETKIKKILPEITGKNFVQTNPKQWEYIVALKDFRDEIVHTKKDADTHTPFKDIYINAFQLDFDSIILAARDLINFYQPNLVVECGCGKD